MLPLRDLRFQGHEGTFSKTKASVEVTMQAPTLKADMWHAGGALHAKEKVGWGGGAHRGWCSVWERENGERLWVSALCLSEKTRRGGELSNNSQMIWAIPMR